MKIPLFQVDAFSSKIFGGNPAAVCPLTQWLCDEEMLLIAAENNLAETAFFLPTEEEYHLRWFTPEYEIDLCGHATLATAHVLFQHLGYTGDKITFSSKSGLLRVTKKDQLLTLDFPPRPPQPASLPPVIAQGIGKAPLEVLKSRDYVLVYETEEDVHSLKPNQALLDTINLDPGGIIVTAPGNSADFVSRFFTPQASIFEDPVTGSAHCSLVPYWAKKFKKNSLRALQLSKRGGELWCELKENRVLISGQAATYLEGYIALDR